MYLTRVRLLTLAVPVALAVAACGQVTGLSDDYTYDLEAGAAAADGATTDAAKADGATGDGATDAGVDATNKCTTAQTVATAKKLNNGFNGTQLCKTCLATSCCSDVDTCTANGDCNHVLGCKLDCTEKQAAERNACFKMCTLAGNTQSTVFQSTVAPCAAAACTSQCGLQ
jgi:hypothetical protein